MAEPGSPEQMTLQELLQAITATREELYRTMPHYDETDRLSILLSKLLKELERRKE